MKKKLPQNKENTPCFSLRGVFVLLAYALAIYGLAAIMDKEGVTHNLQYAVQKKVDTLKVAVSDFVGWEIDPAQSALLANGKDNTASTTGNRAKQPSPSFHYQPNVYSGSYAYYLPHYKENIDL